MTVLMLSYNSDWLINQAYGAETDLPVLPISSLEREAAHSDPAAQYYLGRAYYLGRGVVEDDQKAFELTRKAADHHIPAAELATGISYLSGTAGSVDWRQARSWFEQALKHGNAEAGMFLGMIYKYGMRVKADRSKSDKYYAQARQILEKNAADGDYIAKDRLSRIFYFGLGVKQDYKKSRKWGDQLSKDEAAKLALYSSRPRSENPSDEYSAAYYSQNHNFLLGDEDVKALLDAAEQGVMEAREVAAFTYLRGSQQLSKNPNKALEWFLRVAVYGGAEGSYASGMLIEESHYGLQDNEELARQFYHQSLDLLQLQIHHDDTAETRYILGLIYKLGLGVPAQISLGNKYLNEACNLALRHNCADLSPDYLVKRDPPSLGLVIQHIVFKAQAGDIDAQIQMALFFQTGSLVAHNLKKAFNYFQEAAKQGDANVQFIVGHYYQKGLVVKRDPQMALKFFKKASDNGVIDAFVTMGDIYRRGDDGVPKDAVKAQEMYHHALALEDQKLAVHELAAYGPLAYLYLNGYGVKKDTKKAVELYSVGAKGEDPGAESALAKLYYEGIGVRQDYEKARELSEDAAMMALTFGEAEATLGRLYLEGKGGIQDTDKARKLFETSAMFNNPEGLYLLGTVYEQGLGSEKDSAKATTYYHRACELSYQEACRKLKGS